MNAHELGPLGGAAPVPRGPTAKPGLKAATQPTQRPPQPREGFLDTIRAIATIRVILWHAFGTPALSYLVASMPTMFFVAGSLFAASLERKSFGAVLRDRLRRILLPFWLYGCFAIGAMALSRLFVGGPRSTLGLARVAGWVFPIVDPKGNGWEGGWLSQPLWYLRALLWLMLATPLLVRGMRRFGTLMFVPPVLGVFAVDLAIRKPQLVPPVFGAVRWYIGDFALYSVFWMLGLRHRAGAFTAMPRRVRSEWLLIAAGCAAIWCTTQPIIGGVVNNSYPAHLAVGFTWLFIFLVAQPLLATVPESRLLGPVVRWLTRRSLTVYLWHTTAIVCSDFILARFAPTIPRVVILPFVAIFVVLFSATFGWCEDLAANRPCRLWPVPFRLLDSAISNVGSLLSSFGWTQRLTRLAPSSISKSVRPAVFGFFGAMLLVAIVPSGAVPGTVAQESPATAVSGSSPTPGTHRRPPAPSARPDTAIFAASPTPSTTSTAPVPSSTAPTETMATPTGPSATVPAAAAPATTLAVAPVATQGATSGARFNTAQEATLQKTLDEWRTEFAVAGVTVGLRTKSGQAWSSGSGSLKTDEVVEVTSVTKSFTAALVLRLADKGLIKLDDPLPLLAAVPTFPASAGITPRQLLNHTSGLATYQDSPEYLANPGMKLTPAVAVKLAAGQPLLWKPGANSGYSSSGYLTLGLLAEQAGGKSLKELFHQEFFDPLGLTHTELDALPPVDGWIGWSTGGITTNMSDLTTWGSALLRERTVLSPESSKAMSDVNNAWSVGLGLWPVCPCSLGPKGEKVYTSIGHNGGSGTYQYAPSDGTVIAAFLTEPIFSARITQQDLYELLARLRTALNSVPNG